jgi:hypothetical protein
MLIPEYSISNKILNLISDIERNRGFIDSSFILPFSQNSLKKESKEKKAFHLLQLEEFNLNMTELKRYLDSISPHLNPEIHSILEVILNLDKISKEKISFEKKVKLLSEKISQNKSVFRIKKIPNKTNPDEILAKMIELFSWIESEDAKNTHPLIVSAIILAVMERNAPFEKHSSLTSNLSSEIYLIENGYGIIELIPHQENLNLKRFKFSDSLEYINKTEDFTEWLEFYLENINYQMHILKDKYNLLKEQSKQAQIPDIEKLTARQQRIYQYLLDYKFLQNSQFMLLFPEISEDSILRDLKVLIDKNLIIKSGKTKSSKYELKH